MTLLKYVRAISRSNGSQSYLPFPAHYHTRFSLADHAYLLRILLFGCLLFGLTGCGPERTSASTDELRAETRRIADVYQADGDLDRARAELQELDVANPNQWLIIVTESYINASDEMAVTSNLVQLVGALGLQSSIVAQFLGETSIIDSTQGSSETLDGGSADTVKLAATPTVTVPPTTVAAQEKSAGQVEPTIASEIEIPTLIPVPIEANARAVSALNIRSGPGTNYAIVASLQSGESAAIIGKNPPGDWWQIQQVNGPIGWVLGALVESSNTETVAVAINIPDAPPTSEPVAAVVGTPEFVIEESPAEPNTEPDLEPVISPSNIPHFTLVEKRMWSKEENGGCRGQHLLRINVVDANGVRINGVALQGVYLGDIIVTGSQGKGDGVIEWDLTGSGEDFRVIRNDDGRDASSDVSSGHTTRSVDIPKDLLIQTGYCSSSEDCETFYDSWGCQGHHSWEATFRRNY